LVFLEELLKRYKKQYDQLKEAGNELSTIYEGRQGIRLDSSPGQMSISEEKVGNTRDLVAKDFGISGRYLLFDILFSRILLNK